MECVPPSSSLHLVSFNFLFAVTIGCCYRLKRPVRDCHPPSFCWRGAAVRTDPHRIMHGRSTIFVVLASYALLLAATLNGAVDGKRLRSSQKALHAERHETFVDVNGGFVGTSKCVDGILYAQLLARNRNTPVEELPGFIREYCEEDIALALGVPEKDFKSSASKIWRQAFRERGGDAGRNNSTRPNNIVITAKNQVVRVSAELSLKLDMSSKLCTRLSAFYRPGRFANRQDALVYCKAVKKSLAGRLEEAMESVPSLPKPLMKLTDHNTPEALAAAKVKCKPGSSKIECGMDADGSRVIVAVQRNKGSFKAEANRVKINTKAAAKAEVALNQYEATQSRLEQLKALRDKKQSRNVIIAKVQLSTDLSGKAQKLMMTRRSAQNLLTVALVRAYGSIDMKDVALHKLSGMGKEKAIVDPISGKTANRMVYDTQLSLNVPQGENVLRGLLVNMENTDAVHSASEQAPWQTSKSFLSHRESRGSP